MLHYLRVIMVMVIAAVNGCATVHVDADYDPAADFSSLRTYAWIDSDGNTTQLAERDIEFKKAEPIIDARIRAAIDSGLAARGYRKTNIQAADFLVVYHVGVRDVRDIQVVQRYYGYRHYPGYHGYGAPGPTVVTQPIVYEYKEGRLVLDIVNKHQDRLMWRGSALGYISEYDSAEDRRQRIQKAIHDMLEKFPPR